MENGSYLLRLFSLSDAKQNLLAGIIGLVRASVENNTATDHTAAVLENALAALKCGDDARCRRQLQAVRQEKNRIAPDCAVCDHPCGRTAEYPMEELGTEDPALQEQKAGMLFALLEQGTPPLDFSDVCRRLFMFGYEKDAGQFAAFCKENAIAAQSTANRP